jgi:hypothetical protein
MTLGRLTASFRVGVGFAAAVLALAVGGLVPLVDAQVLPPRPRSIEIVGGRILVDGNVTTWKIPTSGALPRGISAGTRADLPGALGGRLDSHVGVASSVRRSGVRPAGVSNEVNLSVQTVAQSESTIASSAARPSNLVAGANELESGKQAFYTSSNSGATWTKGTLPVLVGHTFTSDPTIAADADGNWYFASITGTATPTNLVVNKSTDGGLTWGAPSTVVIDFTVDKPWIAADAWAASPRKNTVYVAYDLATGGVFLAKSTNGGTVWSAPVRVDVLDPTPGIDATGKTIYTMPAVAPNGDVYVVWEDYNGFTNVPSGIFVRRSTDGGATFGAQVKVTNTNIKVFENPTFIPAQNQRGIAPVPVLTVDAAHVLHLVYGDRSTLSSSNHDANIFYRRSTDFGATWSTPVKLNDDATSTSQFFPWIAVDPTRDTLHVAWYDCRNDTTNNREVDVYYTRSSNRGLNWDANTRVTSVATFDSGSPIGNVNQRGDYLGVASLGGVAHPAWVDARLLATNKEEVFSATISDSPSCTSPAGTRCIEPFVPAGSPGPPPRGPIQSQPPASGPGPAPRQI